MEHVPVTSSNIKSVAFADGKLSVRFKCSPCNSTGKSGIFDTDALNGNRVERPCAKCDGLGYSEYAHTELPPDPEDQNRKPIDQAHAEMMAAPSLGAYYAANIRGKFQTERV